MQTKLNLSTESGTGRAYSGVLVAGSGYTSMRKDTNIAVCGHVHSSIKRKKNTSTGLSMPLWCVRRRFRLCPAGKEAVDVRKRCEGSESGPSLDLKGP